MRIDRLALRGAIAAALVATAAATSPAVADEQRTGTYMVAQTVYGSYGVGAGSGGAVPSGLLVTLVDEGHHVIPGKTVRFVGASDGTPICSAVSGQDGRASCGDPTYKLNATLTLGFVAIFDGDETFAPSQVKGSLIRVNGQNAP